MKKFLVCSIFALFFCGCAHKADFQIVKPLPCSVNLSQLTDATVPAEFTTNDFNWTENKLRMAVYSEDLYDAVQISKLKAGDTIVYERKPIVVKKIEDKDGFLTVNNGIEEGGAYLLASQGGTYRGVQMDDHSIYTKLGQLEIPLAKDFTIIDCGEDFKDPSDTIRSSQKLYLENIKEYRRQFSCLDTKVKIENGKITNITRHWIP